MRTAAAGSGESSARNMRRIGSRPSFLSVFDASSYAMSADVIAGYV
jgi:hypothetical protein